MHRRCLERPRQHAQAFVAFDDPEGGAAQARYAERCEDSGGLEGSAGQSPWRRSKAASKASTASESTRSGASYFDGPRADLRRSRSSTTIDGGHVMIPTHRIPIASRRDPSSTEFLVRDGDPTDHAGGARLASPSSGSTSVVKRQYGSRQTRPGNWLPHSRPRRSSADEPSQTQQRSRQDSSPKRLRPRSADNARRGGLRGAGGSRVAAYAFITATCAGTSAATNTWACANVLATRVADGGSVRRATAIRATRRRVTGRPARATARST